MTRFATEADLCAAFAEAVPNAWTVYNETAGFDMVVVHETGFQIGIEAKLKLNPKVVLQAADSGYRRGVGPGPDARAVLVPAGTRSELAEICTLLSITVVTLAKRTHRGKLLIEPELPKADVRLSAEGKIQTLRGSWLSHPNWHDLCPAERLELPEYVPDVQAGTPSPIVLGRWKIQAIKVCVWVEKHGAITRAHFRALEIDPGRWMTGVWLKKGAVRGEWIAGPGFPLSQFRNAHGRVVEQVKRDYGRWSVETGLAGLPAVSGKALANTEPLL